MGKNNINIVKFEVGKKTDIPCPDCGQPLVVRENRETGNQFLGCSTWPECDYARKIPEEWKMRATGQSGLFDEEESCRERKHG